MILLLSISLLLLLILTVRLSAFVSLIITALFAGLAAGMAPGELIRSVQTGLGNTLGGLALVLALGIILGSMLSETGAIRVISSRLLSLLGRNNAGTALMLTGFVVGLALFYNAGFVVLAPLVFSVAAQTGLPLAPLAISMAAPLSVTHGFLPPHPGATAVANALGADPGKTLLWGLAAGIPVLAVTALIMPRLMRTVKANPPASFTQAAEITDNGMAVPGFTKSLLIALMPVILMGVSSAAAFLMNAGDPLLEWIRFAGDPGNSLLAAVLCALLFLGSNRFQNSSDRLSTSQLFEKSGVALGAASTLLLVTAAGGAFKQVLTDSGAGNTVAELFSGVNAPPLLLGWAIATTLRIAIGSATIAGMTAAGIALPVMQSTGASPELMTLAIGAGSLMCSHLNDTGFWMFREWFGLSLKDTFRSWTLMETLVGTLGIIAVLILDTLI
jgi:Gnt-I system high-affinity gluconate transporter/Gnt-II system L-idonate transporter